MIYKAFKYFINHEKEEKWINEMALKGMNLKHYNFGFYTFEEGASGEYTYRIELLKEMPSHPESRAYIRFLEESGVECVCTFIRWVYFRKKTSEGPFELFTDRKSKIAHYKRIALISGIFAGLNTFYGLMNLVHNTYIYIWILNLAAAALLLSIFIRQMVRIYAIKREMKIYE